MRTERGRNSERQPVPERRASDKELLKLRQAELSVRNFITHFDDHPESRFAPHTRRMVKETRAIFKELDEMRAARAKKAKQ